MNRKMKRVTLILLGFMLLISCGKNNSLATNTESNTETAVETEQEIQKKVIKKSIEKTGEETLTTEYVQQSNIIEIRYSNCSDCPFKEFTLKDGKIISAKRLDNTFPTPEIDKQKNIAIFNENDILTFEFNEYGIKKYNCQYIDAEHSISYEYNNDGLLVNKVEIWKNNFEDSSEKTTTTYTYDVMSQDWTKRTGTDNKGNKIVTTRTVEYW